MAARGGGDMDIVNVLYLTDNTKVETVDEMAKHGERGGENGGRERARRRAVED